MAFHQVTYFEEKGAEVLRTRLRVSGDLTPTFCAGALCRGQAGDAVLPVGAESTVLQGPGQRLRSSQKDHSSSVSAAWASSV